MTMNKLEVGSVEEKKRRGETNERTVVEFDASRNPPGVRGSDESRKRSQKRSAGTKRRVLSFQIEVGLCR